MIKTILVVVHPQYWADAIVNGLHDKEGDLIPCRNGDDWRIVIDAPTGVITNWKKGVTATVQYKVGDKCSYYCYNTTNSHIPVYAEEEQGVPAWLAPLRTTYSDTVHLTINEDGSIANWNYFDDRE